MKIRIFSSFCESKNAKETYERLCNSKMISGYGTQFTLTDQEDYTHVIIMNIAMPNIEHIPKERVIGLAFEPFRYLCLTTEFVKYAQKYIGKYFIGQKDDLPEPFVEHIAYLWHCPPLSYIPVKNNIMSIMISHKNQAPGHIYRHELMKAILKIRLPIDIYGNGCAMYPFVMDHRFKGAFKEYEPYENYKFHIAIENFVGNDYFSEKIMNPLLCSCVPVYLGCKNIENYFPGQVIRLTGNIVEDLQIITNIVRNPEQYKKHIDLNAVKHKINLLRNIETIF